MINKEIIELTLEQEAEIAIYREKWRSKAFSTAPIDKEKATQAIQKAYQLIGYDVPHQILFFLVLPRLISGLSNKLKS